MPKYWMLHPSLFHENFCDKHAIDRVQYQDYLLNMLYIIHIHNQEVIGTPTYLLAHTHGSSIFNKVKYFDYLIKNRNTISSMPALIYKYICPPTRDKFSKWCVAIAKIQIDIPVSNLLGHTYRCFNHSSYLVDI